MVFGRKIKGPPPPQVDPSAWLIESGLAEFLLMHTVEIKYMAMLGYTYLHGCKLFDTFTEKSSTSFKFVSMVLQCTGGGIIVPLFINTIPVPLAQDLYPIAILCSFLIHHYMPVLRDVVKLSPILKISLTILYEIVRASVVVKFTSAAGALIKPSEFSFAVFGPIFCGTIAGCGGAFFPLSKGLDPIRNAGLTQPMSSAFLAATFYHIFLKTSLSENIIKADQKAHFGVVAFFIAHHILSILTDSTKPMLSQPATSIAGKDKSS